MGVLSWLTGAFKAAPEANLGGRIQLAEREAEGMGPWTGALGGFVAREVNPSLYEALREALPPLDAAVNRLTTLDGIVRVGGGNDRLVAEVLDFIDHVPVNDFQTGLQAAYSGGSNELYEQGVAITEFVLSRDGKDVTGLRLADSKGVHFQREASGRMRVWYRPPGRKHRLGNAGTSAMEEVIRGRHEPLTAGQLHGYGYVELDRAALLIDVHAPEADNPYGVSLFRSMEFVSQILLKMDNAIGRAWDRFGDPPLRVIYKTKNRQVAQDSKLLAKRATEIAAQLARVMKIKAQGNSADFVQALGADDELEVSVIGGDGQVLDVEMPARHLLEQVVAKTGLPSWILGFHWSTAERLAGKQAELLLQESRTRYALRYPGLQRLVAAVLRRRGRTWRPGDWYLWQDLPNLTDVLATAQAEFMRVQSAVMLAERGIDPTDVLDSDEVGAQRGRADAKALVRRTVEELRVKTHGRPRVDLTQRKNAEPFADPNPALPRIEDEAVAKILALWRGGEVRARTALGLPPPAEAAKSSLEWRWEARMLPELLGIGRELELAIGGEEGALVQAAWEALVAGWAAGAAEIGASTAITDVATVIRAALQQRGLELVRNVTARRLRNRIVAELASGAYDGMNPLTVAQKLRQLFDAGDYDWERLARSEITAANARGKITRWEAEGVTHYDYVTADDDRVSDICRENEASSPYEMGKGPLPMTDSHPNCRCTVMARLNARD